MQAKAKMPPPSFYKPTNTLSTSIRILMLLGTNTTNHTGPAEIAFTRRHLLANPLRPTRTRNQHISMAGPDKKDRSLPILTLPIKQGIIPREKRTTNSWGEALSTKQEVRHERSATTTTTTILSLLKSTIWVGHTRNPRGIAQLRVIIKEDMREGYDSLSTSCIPLSLEIFAVFEEEFKGHLILRVSLLSQLRHLK